MKKMKNKTLINSCITLFLIFSFSNLYGQCVPGTNAGMNIIGGTSTCEGELVNVQNNVTDDGAVLSYLWYWNADDIAGYTYDTIRVSNNNNQTYTYNFPDSIVNCNSTFLELEIQLEVFDTCGTYPNRNSSPILVYVKPRAFFTTTSPVCSGEAISFMNSTCPNVSPDISYQWDFGDPTTTSDFSTQENPSYTYTSSGTFTVTLTATNNAAPALCGILSDTYTYQVIVLDAPEPQYTLSGNSLNATQDTMCAGDLLTITSQSNHTDSISIEVSPNSGVSITPNAFQTPFLTIRFEYHINNTCSKVRMINVF